MQGSMLDAAAMNIQHQDQTLQKYTSGVCRNDTILTHSKPLAI